MFAGLLAMLELLVTHNLLCQLSNMYNHVCYLWKDLWVLVQVCVQYRFSRVNRLDAWAGWGFVLFKHNRIMHYSNMTESCITQWMHVLLNLFSTNRYKYYYCWGIELHNICGKNKPNVGLHTDSVWILLNAKTLGVSWFFIWRRDHMNLVCSKMHIQVFRLASWN